MNINFLLKCPITKKIMNDPVVSTQTGYTFERNAIETYAKIYNMCPITNIYIKNKWFPPNRILKEIIDYKKTYDKSIQIMKYLLILSYIQKIQTLQKIDESMIEPID
tara:strand:+ start:259 stop:579 length:321 start_codon:yes stop_codon:yes gene_type:complete